MVFKTIVNPFSSVSWAWKALRGQSVTFAALFALALCGFSVIHWMRLGLRELGFGWIGFILVPIIIIGTIARKENEWMPDEKRRRRWSKGLVFGALLFLVVEAKIRSYFTESRAAPPASQTPSSVRK